LIRRTPLLAAAALAALAPGCFPTGEMNPFDSGAEPFERATPPPVLAVRWRLDLSNPAPFEVTPQERAAPGFAADGHDLYVASASGRVERIDADTRERRWEFSADGGIDCTPLQPAGSRLVYFGSDDGALYALEAGTGRLAWRFNTRGEIDGPLAAAAGAILFTNSDGALYSIDAATGALRWSARRDVPEGFGLRGSSPPTVAGDTVYAGFADGWIGAFELDGGIPRWQTDLSGGKRAFVDVDGRPLVRDGVVYAASFSGGVFALAADTGALLWRRADALGVGSVAVGGEPALLPPPAPGLPATARAATGAVLYVAASTTGEIEAVRPTDGTRIWAVKVRGRLTDPLVVGGRLFVGSDEDGLIVFDRWSGTLLRTFTPGSAIGAVPAVASNGIYVTSEGGFLYRLDWM